MSNFLTWCCCSQGWEPFLFHGAKHLSMQATRARKNSKIFSLLHDFLVCFLTCSSCPPSWVACIFHCTKHPFMQATQARKNWNSLLYCMISLYIIWHAAAAWPCPCDVLVVQSWLCVDGPVLVMCWWFSSLCVGDEVLVVCWWCSSCYVFLVWLLWCVDIVIIILY